MKIAFVAAVVGLLSVTGSLADDQILSQFRSGAFVHPGMLHSAADLERIKKNVQDGVEPWASAWREFQTSRFLAKDYEPWPLEVVGRGVGSAGQDNISGDGAAAYYNALAWYVTGDEAYAKKTIEILNAWSYKCKTINGKDAVLCAGIYGYKFANAAEIMRYCYREWPEKDIQQFKVLLREVFYPVIKDFATYANGNWDACCLPTMMSIGIFCDDRAMFDRAVRYYMDGSGNGSLMHYIINETGQCQESGRDQGHTQAGIGHLAIACEIAYQQGIDLYSVADNRLLKGFEYTAKYILGNDVPFMPYSDRTGKYKANVISNISRRQIAAIYEMAYNHYCNRLRLGAPFTAQAAARSRPERSAIDHPGNGTLLFALPPYQPSDEPPTVAPAVPGPIIVKGSSSANTLQWAASLNASGYAVKRSNTSGGPYKTIAENVKSPAYVDQDVQPGKLYYYVVSAVNAVGTSADTLEAGSCAGLPSPWRQQDVGAVEVQGGTLFDGNTFTLEGAGTDISGKNDQFHFAYLPMVGDGAITARFVPQTPSQFATMGLMMRESLDPDSAYVALLIDQIGSKSVEIPDWKTSLFVRPTSGAKILDPAGSVAIGPPCSSWGRLLEPYWLRLQRSDNSFTASVSIDGKLWTMVGKVNVAVKKEIFMGLAACSRLPKISTTIMFDNVTISNLPSQSPNF